MGGKFCFPLARQNLNGTAAGALPLGYEIRTVRGIAHGGGCDHTEVLDLQNTRNGAEAAQSCQSTVDSLFAEHSRGGHRPAKAAQDLLVEQRRGGSDRPLINDKAH